MTPPQVGEARVVDVSDIPSYGFGHRSLMWWGTAGMMAIEGSVFALAAFAYFYVRTRVNEWPPSALAPELLWGTLNTVLMLASLLPNQWAKKAAEREDLPAVRIAIWTCVLFGAGFLVLRGFEFTALNVRWDTNAYGSAVWMLLALHTLHVGTDFWDTTVLAVLMMSDRIEGRRYVDVSENALYWYFVVALWVPLYVIIYWVPRWM